MFFFIGGIQPKTILIEKQPRACPSCGYYEVSKKRVDHYVSLFFIPLFPVKKGTPFLFCENCKTSVDDTGYRVDFEKTEGEKRCPYCGKEVDPHYRFCPYCGKGL